LVNDGGAAYEIAVEPFDIAPAVRARSNTLPRIEERGKGFVIVWLDGYSLAPSVAKWDLLQAIADVDKTKFGDLLMRPTLA
jgi:hypothetical protein